MDIFLTKKPNLHHFESVFGDDKSVLIIDGWDAVPEDYCGTHLVMMSENESEFPIGLSFQSEQNDLENWLLNAARYLSVMLACRSLYTGSPLEGTNPYHSIVFMSGKAFLADDCDTKLAGEGEASVRIIRGVPKLDSKNV